MITFRVYKVQSYNSITERRDGAHTRLEGVVVTPAGAVEVFTQGGCSGYRLHRDGLVYAKDEKGERGKRGLVVKAHELSREVLAWLEERD